MFEAPMLQQLPENLTGRDWVVGDIHGCVDDLLHALDTCGFDFDQDRLLSVGDLIDRGHQSYEALHLLYRGSVPGVYRQWFYAVRGNHEVMMMDALLTQDLGAMRRWVSNGGGWMLEYDLDELRMIARDRLAQLPVALEVPVAGKRVGIIHADVSSGHWGLFNPQRDLWSRERFRSNPSVHPGRIEGIDVVAVGHTICDVVTVKHNVVHLDTGAFWKDGHLTILPATDLLAMNQFQSQ